MEAPLVSRNEPGSAAVVRESRLMRTVNREIRRQSETGSLTEPVAFFCECRDPACHSTVWVSAAAFDAALADRSNWWLREGHKPSMSWHPRHPFPTGRSSRTPLHATRAAAVPPGGTSSTLLGGTR